MSKPSHGIDRHIDLVRVHKIFNKVDLQACQQSDVKVDGVTITVTAHTLSLCSVRYKLFYSARMHIDPQ